MGCSTCVGFSPSLFEPTTLSQFPSMPSSSTCWLLSMEHNCSYPSVSTGFFSKQICHSFCSRLAFFEAYAACFFSVLLSGFLTTVSSLGNSASSDGKIAFGSSVFCSLLSSSLNHSCFCHQTSTPKLLPQNHLKLLNVLSSCLAMAAP